MTNKSKYYVFYDKEEYNDYLVHSGVKGMKWGVRKAVEYVKKGAKAVAKGTKKAAKATKSQAQAIAKKIKAKRALSAEKKNTKTAESAKVNKDTKNMSDKELDSVIRRMEQERRYRDVYAQLHPKEDSFKSRLAEAAKKGAESGVQTLISRQIPEIGSRYINELIADPTKKQQSQLNMKKNIIETEAWIKEFESTKKRPDWEIGKGPSAPKKEDDPVKKELAQLNMQKNILETKAWIKEFEDSGKRPDWEIGKGSNKSNQGNQSNQKPKEEKPKEEPKEDKPKTSGFKVKRKKKREE